MAEGVWNGSMCNSACPADTEHQGGPQDINSSTWLLHIHGGQGREQGLGSTCLHSQLHGANPTPPEPVQDISTPRSHWWRHIAVSPWWIAPLFALSHQLLEGWKSNPGSVKYSDFKQCFFPKTFKISWIWFDGHPNTLCTAEQEAAFTDPSRFALDEEGGSLLYSACAGDAESQLFLY